MAARQGRAPVHHRLRHNLGSQTGSQTVRQSDNLTFRRTYKYSDRQVMLIVVEGQVLNNSDPHSNPRSPTLTDPPIKQTHTHTFRWEYGLDSIYFSTTLHSLSFSLRAGGSSLSYGG